MLITILEYCKKFGISKSTIYSQISRGRLKSEKINGVYMIDDSTVIKLHNSEYNGKSYTSLYNRWRCMKKRCYNQNTSEYERYGGRGITVCEEWINSSDAFIEWALSHGYKEELQIDRIDNNKGYSPDNCRWVTPKVNMNNRRKKSIHETFKNSSHPETWELKRIERARKKFLERCKEKEWYNALHCVPKDILYGGYIDDLINEQAELFEKQHKN